jgi:hypothetical protein
MPLPRLHEHSRPLLSYYHLTPPLSHCPTRLLLQVGGPMCCDAGALFGVSYTREVSAPKREQPSTIGEATSKELGRSGAQFAVGAPRQRSLP